MCGIALLPGCCEPPWRAHVAVAATWLLGAEFAANGANNNVN
jgi:hypothetical protein